ncbi:MAG TPA: hypothetical protein VFL27_07815 [Candidatus Dormibacteraeota bacterium]|nr:hypothetical protein [Candidatus Dormibacteraeota bacterium]
MTDFALAGAMVAVWGLVLVFNVGRAAETVARLAAAAPWWLKWPLRDGPTGYRWMGGGAVVIGLVLAAAGPHLAG